MYTHPLEDYLIPEQDFKWAQDLIQTYQTTSFDNISQLYQPTGFCTEIPTPELSFMSPYQASVTFSPQTLPRYEDIFDSEVEDKKEIRLAKNRLAAKRVRYRKKQQMQTAESDCKLLCSENIELKKKLVDLLKIKCQTA